MLNGSHALYAFKACKDAQLACFNKLTQHILRRCTVQPSQAQCLFSCSLGIEKHFQTERLLSLAHGMFKDFIDLSILEDTQPGFSSQSVASPDPFRKVQKVWF